MTGESLNEVRPYGAHCPYCGERIELLVDCSLPEQVYIEDCEVCCRPMQCTVLVDETGEPLVSVAHENE